MFLSGNTTNLQFHLDHEHRDLKEATGASSTACGKQKAAHQLNIKEAFTKPNERMSANKQKEIDNALMTLMIKKVLPLSLVDHESFKTFVSLLDPRYVVPCRKTLNSMLERKHEDMKKKLKNDLKDLKDISITHDGWTSMNTESFETFTGHFISQDWQLKSVAVETIKVEGSHTAEHIARNVQKVQQTWVPNMKPIAVTDNAANEQKAFEILKWHRFGCYGHRINRIVSAALQVPAISHIVGKGRKLVTYFHQSSSATDLLKVKQASILTGGAVGHKLVQDVATRWNSTYLMLNRIMEQIPAIMATVTDPTLSKSAASSLKNYVYSFEEQTTVEKLVEVLQPFYMATNIISADRTPTMQKVLPMLVKLRRMTEHSDDDPEAISKVKTIMRKQLDMRVVDQDDELVSMAVILNPFTKSMDFLTATEKEKNIQMLREKVKAISMKNLLWPNFLPCQQMMPFLLQLTR